MQDELESLKFPIGKYKAMLDFNFSRTVEDIRTLESFAEALRNSVKGLDKTDFKKSYRDGGMNIAQIIHHFCDTHTYAFLRTKHTLLEENPSVKMYEVAEFLTTPDSNVLDVKDSLNVIDGIHAKWVSLLKTLSEEDFKKTYYHSSRDKNIILHEHVGMYAWHTKHHIMHIEIIKKISNKGKRKVEILWTHLKLNMKEI